MKANLENLKNEIKRLVAIQIDTKNQRKTVNFNGDRTLEPWRATMNAQYQRDELRTHYQAYAFLKGKDTTDHGEIINTYLFNNLLDKYKDEEAVCNN
jgi:hypothetical protein